MEWKLLAHKFLSRPYLYDIIFTVVVVTKSTFLLWLMATGTLDSQASQDTEIVPLAEDRSSEIRDARFHRQRGY